MSIKKCPTNLVHWLDLLAIYMEKVLYVLWYLGNLGKLSYFTNLNCSAMNGDDSPYENPWFPGFGRPIPSWPGPLPPDNLRGKESTISGRHHACVYKLCNVYYKYNIVYTIYLKYNIYIYTAYDFICVCEFDDFIMCTFSCVPHSTLRLWVCLGLSRSIGRHKSK